MRDDDIVPSISMSTKAEAIEPMPSKPTAEIIPHPMMRIRYAQQLRAAGLDDGQLKDSVKQYRKKLQQLDVKPERITADVETLEAIVFNPPILRRRA